MLAVSVDQGIIIVFITSIGLYVFIDAANLVFDIWNDFYQIVSILRDLHDVALCHILRIELEKLA